MNKPQHLKSEYLKGFTRHYLQIVGGMCLIMTIFASALQAQTTFKPFQIRAEWPAGVGGTLILSNNNLRVATNGASILNDGFGTNWSISSVTISVSGAPAGVTATLTDSSGNPVTTVPVNLNTGSAAMNTNLLMKFVFDGTQVSGTSTINFTFTGGVTNGYFSFPLDVAKVWNGLANAAVNGAGSWSDGSQWLGGAPVTGDSVVFTDLGAQTNLFVSTTTTTNVLTNSFVDTSTVLSSLRFALTNAAGTPKTNWQNISIANGQTLAINGQAGLSVLRDIPYCTYGVMNISIYGTNASFVQTNESSTFSILSDAQQNSVLDMTGLGSVKLDINRFYLSDYLGYPNYQNLVYTNGYSNTTIGQGKPQRFYMTWKMSAITNYIKATYVDANNYTNSRTRTYALTLGHNEASGGGSGKDVEMFMGSNNVFNLDGICVGGSFCLGADLQFANSGSFAKFRNVDGVSRMSIFATADAGGNDLASGLGDNTKCGGNGLGVDFTKGSVDMLVDRLYLSMDRANVTVSGKGVSQTSGFYFTAGTIDANTAILGYQSEGTQTNQSYCYVTMTVSNTAVLKVNKELALGYSSCASGSANAEFNGYGKINLGPGGTIMANTITVGGLTKVSAGNNISLFGNASLIVSNRIADSTPNGALGSLSLSGGNNSLTLFVNGTNASAAIVYLTNLVSSGTGNKLIVGGVTNLTYPAYVPLILGVNSGVPISASAFDAGVVMPPGSGLFGTLVTSSSNTIDLQIISRTPNNLVWRAPAGGSGTADWDYTTKNWLDRNTGIMTNYENPDIVTFDDTPGYATNINLAGVTPFTPSSMTVTNTGLYYTFSGANLINGGPVLTKNGTGILQIDGTTTCSVQVNQGVVIGSGAIGNATVAPAGVLYYSGNLNGSLNSSGIATTLATISGSLTVLNGGMTTNAGTASGAVTVQSGGLLVNAGTLSNIGTGSSGSPQVATNGTLINGGTISGDVLYVNGTLKDLGGSANMTLTSVSFGPGAVFIPGGDGLATTTVYSDGVGSFPGAILLAQGSQTIFKIDPATPANAMAKASHLSFGASASVQTVNGCTLVISNITLTPFSAGQSFQLFDNVYIPGTAPFNTGSSTNTYPVISPSTPGAGLSWDLSQLWSNGSVRVITTPVITLTNSFSVVGGSNIISTFSWPSDQQWVLQSQTSTLDVGLTTNWTRITGSWTNTDADVAAGYRTRSITNSISTNSATFYRLVFP